MNKLFKLYYLFFYTSKFLATEKLTNGAIIPPLKVLLQPQKRMAEQNHMHKFMGYIMLYMPQGGNFEAHKILQFN